MAQYIQKPRGTMDVFPEEAAYWQKIERTARDVAARFGFGEIKTPTFEDINLFRSAVQISLIDTAIALIAGFAVFPAAYRIIVRPSFVYKFPSRDR